MKSATSIRLRPAPNAPLPRSVMAFESRDAFILQRLRVLDDSSSDLVSTAQRIERTPFPRGELVTNLLSLNRDCENPSAQANIEALEDPKTLIVATGQQPGLCGGPLYSVYKAATAIAKARHLSRLLDRRVVPLFWIASDDHDLAEIGGLTLLTQDLDLRKHRVRFARERIPSGRVVVDESISEVFEAIRSDPASELANVDFPAPRLGERWPIWFGRILSYLFPDSGLVLFEPTACRSLLQPFLARETSNPSRSVDALIAGAAALSSAGIEPAFAAEEMPSLLFHVAEDRRQRWNPHLTDSALDDSSLSPDAALRCVMQSGVLPTILVIGGPGELNYWMQLRELFAAHAIDMPYFGLRFSGTLVTPPLRRAAEAVGIAESDWFRPERELEERIKRLTAVDTEPWESAAAAVRAAFQSFAAPLARLGGSLPNKTSQAENALAGSLAKLIESGAQRVRESSGVSEKKVRLLSRSVYPSGVLQERTYSTLPYLGRFGADVFERLAGEIPSEHLGHSWIDLGTATAPGPT